MFVIIVTKIIITFIFTIQQQLLFKTTIEIFDNSHYLVSNISKRKYTKFEQLFNISLININTILTLRFINIVILNFLYFTFYERIRLLYFVIIIDIVNDS